MQKLRYIIIFLSPLLSYLFLNLYFNQLKEYDNYTLVADQGSYFEASVKLYNQFNAHPNRCIGYPMFLGLPELIGLNPPYGYWPIILNFFFLFGILFFLIKIERLLNYDIALHVSIFLSLCFGFIWQFNMALTEIGFTFFILMAMYFLLKLLKEEKRSNYLFLFIFSMGCASLFRPGLYIFTLVVGVICFFYFLFLDLKTGCYKSILSSLLSVSLALLITLGSQSLFMKKTFNTFRLSYIDDLAWYSYIGALTNTIHEKNCFTAKCFTDEVNKREEAIFQKSSEEMSIISKNDRKNTLQNKRKALFKAYKINLTNNLVSTSWDVKKNPVFHKFSVLVNITLTLFPFLAYLLVLLTRLRKRITKNEHLMLLFILGFIFYIFLTSGISSYQGDRFHIVFYPFSLIFLCFLFFKSKLTFSLKKT